MRCAGRSDRPTHCKRPGLLGGIPVRTSIPCMLVAHGRAAPTLRRRIPWLDAAPLPGAPTSWIRYGWWALGTGGGRGSHHPTTLPSVGTPDAARLMCLRSMMAVTHPMLSATTRRPAIARASDPDCDVPAARTDRPTASNPACSEIFEDIFTHGFDGIG